MNIINDIDVCFERTHGSKHVVKISRNKWMLAMRWDENVNRTHIHHNIQSHFAIPLQTSLWIQIGLLLVVVVDKKKGCKRLKINYRRWLWMNRFADGVRNECFIFLPSWSYHKDTSYVRLFGWCRIRYTNSKHYTKTFTNCFSIHSCNLHLTQWNKNNAYNGNSLHAHCTHTHTTFSYGKCDCDEIPTSLKINYCISFIALRHAIMHRQIDSESLKIYTFTQILMAFGVLIDFAIQYFW